MLVGVFYTTCDNTQSLQSLFMSLALVIRVPIALGLLQQFLTLRGISPSLASRYHGLRMQELRKGGKMTVQREKENFRCLED